ncbi:MAG: cell division protein FtsZ [Bacteroidia bacterium]|nr:cell division protein FtsZ [Bacteroidia bacterium]
MSEEIISFDIPQDETSIIKVIGVGGGGSNAVNYMYELGIKDVNFVICNTDAQALKKGPVPTRIQLGATLTEGRGAGNKPEQGREAAKESLDEIMKTIGEHTKMVFITAGMGGGTGTGAAPIIAKAAKEKGILTVGIVTIPFKFEGPLRIGQAIEGISEMKDFVDSLLVINNEKLREIYGNLKLSEAFKKADNVLTIAAKGIAEIITVHGYVNVDFEDVKTVMKNSGVAIMGSASADGENRASDAIKEALNSPLLNNNDIRGAKNILLNITSGSEEITMDEVGEITDYVLRAVGTDANIIWGNGTDSQLGTKVNVTIIATGFSSNSIPELSTYEMKEPVKIDLEPKQEAESEPLLPEDLELPVINDETENAKEEPEQKPSEIVQPTLEFTDVTEFRVKPISKDKQEGHESRQMTIVEEAKTIKEKYEKLKALSNLNEANVDKFENEPAYKRLEENAKKGEKKNSENSSAEKILSRYTLSPDENNNIQLRENNSFLHDKPD